MRLIIDNTKNPDREVDPALIYEIARARKWFDDLISGKHASIAALAKHYGIPASLISRRISLAFLAPDITEAILAGTQPAFLTPERLTRHCPLPASWEKQRSQIIG